jgi:glc operon protein GlcG
VSVADCPSVREYTLSNILQVASERTDLMRTLKSITTLEARQIADSIAAAISGDGGKPITICVVDVFGDPILIERMDGASGRTVTFSTSKARQAAITGRPTAEEQHDRLADGAWEKKSADPRRDANLRTQNPGYVSFGGGAPVIFEGQCAGGVGVSGRRQLEDHALAEVGAAAVQA